MPIPSNGSGADTAWNVSDPSNPASLVLLPENRIAYNVDNFGTGLFPTLAVTGMPNPSSQLPGSPARNIISPSRDERWIAPGTYVISSSTSEGWVFASLGSGNYELRLDRGLGGGNQDISALTASPTSFYSGKSGRLAMLAKMKTNADANGSLGGTWTLTYDADTRKFTISNSAGTFTMRAKGNHAESILPSLGFTNIMTDYTGASSYTSDQPAFHTEDWFVAQMPVGFWGIPTTAGALSSADGSYRYVAMIDCDYAFGGATTDGMWLYFASSPNSLDDNPDTDFTQYVDYAKLTDENPGAESHIYSANDHRQQVVNVWQAGGGALAEVVAARRWLVDMGGMHRDADFGNQGQHMSQSSYDVIKLKVSCPRNPSGDFRLGHFRVSGGWVPTYNVLLGANVNPRDLSTLTTSPAGKHRSRRRGSATTLRAVFGSRNPLSREDRLFLRDVVGGAWMVDTSTGETVYDPYLGSQANAVLAWLPDADSSVDHHHVGEMLFGRAHLEGFAPGVGKRWHGTVVIEEEAAG